MPQVAPHGPSAGERLRRRPVPTRDLGDRIVVARPRDGAPVVLASTSALVWALLTEWRTADEVDDALDAAFPTVDPDERRRSRADIITKLTDDELLERA